MKSITVAELVPNCAVFMFEPDPVNRVQLARNNALNGARATVLPLALGAESAAARGFYRHRGNAGRSSLSQWAGPDQYERIEVEVASGDELVAQHRVPAPTVIKIDVEGHERDVVRGLDATMSRSEFKVLVFEGAEDFLRRQSNLRDWLTARSFRVQKLARREATDHNLDNYLALAPAVGVVA